MFSVLVIWLCFAVGLGVDAVEKEFAPKIDDFAENDQNWEPLGVPEAGDSIILPQDALMVLNSDFSGVGRVTWHSSSTVQVLPDGVLRLDPDSSCGHLQLLGGTLIVESTMTCRSVSGQSFFSV